MILSLNSSVIDDLITRLDITSLDMQDFAAAAVDSFVESMYSGELENCDKSNFRDLNKMGHVFNVTWFTERCLKYFTELVDELTGRCYEDVLFVVEEARFVEESLKKDEFVVMVETKLNTMRNRKSIFLKQYACDLDNISIHQLKMLIKIAGCDVGILVSILVSHLQKVGACTLTETSRYLFKNIDLEKCFSSNRYFDITSRLFEMLTDNCNEDFKCAVESIFKYTKKPRGSDTEQKSLVVTQYPIMIDMTIRKFLLLDWDSLTDFLSQCDKICNIYQFFDAIFSWLYMCEDDTTTSSPRVVFCNDHVDEVIDIMLDRGWDKISNKYIEAIKSDRKTGTSHLLESFKNSDELSSDDGILFYSIGEECTIEKILTENLKITLVSDKKISTCTRITKCAIMLQCSNTKSEGDTETFVLEMMHSTQSDNEDVHYHSVMEKSLTVSLLIDIISKGKSRVLPMPFNCSPSCTDSDGFRHWGFNQFREHSKSFRGPPCKWIYGYEKNPKVKFLCIGCTSKL